jgi:hypothetical protein
MVTLAASNNSKNNPCDRSTTSSSTTSAGCGPAAAVAVTAAAAIGQPVIRTMHAIDLRWEMVKSKAHATVKKSKQQQQVDAVGSLSTPPIRENPEASDISKDKNGVAIQIQSKEQQCSSNWSNTGEAPLSSSNNPNVISFISKLPSNKWKAEIPYGEKVRCIGSFETYQDAAMAYEYVRTNLGLTAAPAIVVWKEHITLASTDQAKTASTIAMRAKSSDDDAPKKKKMKPSQNRDIHNAAESAPGLKYRPVNGVSKAPPTALSPHSGVDALLAVAKNNNVPINNRSDHGIRLLETVIKNRMDETASLQAVKNAPMTTTMPTNNSLNVPAGDAVASAVATSSLPPLKKRKRETATASTSEQVQWDLAKQEAIKYVKEVGMKLSANGTAGGDGNHDNRANIQQQPEQVPRGVSQRQSGKWQAQLYFAGQMRYIGVFETKELAAMAHEYVREHLCKRP